jgi:hypothetical protein
MINSFCEWFNLLHSTLGHICYNFIKCNCYELYHGSPYICFTLCAPCVICCSNTIKHTNIDNVI